MLARVYRMKATLIILVWTVVCSHNICVAQESSGRSWWNPLGLGMGSSTSSDTKYSSFSGTPVTPAPDTSMPKMDDSSTSSWEWPSLPTPSWKAPSLSLPKPSWPSWMKSSGKTSSKSSSTSTWGKSTKRWWKNTTKMLNPFPSSNSGVVSSSDSGWGGGYSSSSSASTSSSSSWNIFNWWDQPEERKLETPNEFFSLPKP